MAEPDKPPESVPLDSGRLIYKFWANRRGEAIQIQIREYEGRQIIDLRKCFTDKQGRLRPTRKGLSISVRKLPELALGINKACSAASDLGLIASEKAPGNE